MPAKIAGTTTNAAAPKKTANDLIQKGMLAHRQGKFADASKAYEKALKKAPKELAALNLLADAQLNLGKNARAVETAHKAIALKADMPSTWMVKGSAQRRLGKYDEAIRSLETALELKPDYADALMTLAGTLRDAGQLDAAIEAYEDLVEMAPDMAMAYYNLGNALHADGQGDEAIFAFESAIDHDPSYAPSFINLAGVLNSGDRAEEALAISEKALEILPSSRSAMINRGNSLKTLVRFDEAEAQYRELIALDKSDATAHDLLGTVLQGQARIDEAIAEYRAAIAIDGNERLYQGDLSIALLANGSLSEGWKLYDARFGGGEALVRQRKIGKKTWQGESLAGKTLYIWREQGVGDDVRFASCFNDIISRATEEGGKVLIETDPRLMTLYERSFPFAEIRAEGDVQVDGDIDFDIAAGSLPGLVRAALDHFPSKAGYLRPKPEQIARLRAEIDAVGQGLKVGIAWRSRNMTANRRRFYTELEDWKALFGNADIQLINLQYDTVDEEISDVNARFDAQIHQVEGLDLMNDLDSAAALTAAMDVVISAPVSVADIAGAVGSRCFAYGPHRHPMCLGTDHLPWYPETTWIGKRWNAPLQQSVDKIVDDIKALASTR
ncbi:MAG: tetratricopeptide repeat protein [Rhodobiaceae bacterium]|nr:tetratricopeptide repeat protein [Rhodobiaceae bacterium]